MSVLANKLEVTKTSLETFKDYVTKRRTIKLSPEYEAKAEVIIKNGVKEFVNFFLSHCRNKTSTIYQSNNEPVNAGTHARSFIELYSCTNYYFPEMDIDKFVDYIFFEYKPTMTYCGDVRRLVLQNGVHNYLSMLNNSTSVMNTHSISVKKVFTELVEKKGILKAYFEYENYYKDIKRRVMIDKSNFYTYGTSQRVISFFDQITKKTANFIDPKFDSNGEVRFIDLVNELLGSTCRTTAFSSFKSYVVKLFYYYSPELKEICVKLGEDGYNSNDPIFENSQHTIGDLMEDLKLAKLGRV